MVIPAGDSVNVSIKPLGASTISTLETHQKRANKNYNTFFCSNFFPHKQQASDDDTTSESPVINHAPPLIAPHPGKIAKGTVSIISSALGEMISHKNGHEDDISVVSTDSTSSQRLRMSTIGDGEREFSNGIGTSSKVTRQNISNLTILFQYTSISAYFLFTFHCIQVKFPKILKAKRVIPVDSVSAIKSSIASDFKKYDPNLSFNKVLHLFRFLKF